MFQKLGVQLYTVRDYLQDPEFADLTFAKLADVLLDMGVMKL